MPGTSFYLKDVQVTKQKGLGKFDIAGYWQRRYRGHGEDEGWYLLTNSGTLKEAVATFKCRSGIEAMFKDCKTGGYNIEKSHASTERLKTLILLRALAYSCATLQGKKLTSWVFKNMWAASKKPSELYANIVVLGWDCMVILG